MPIPARPSPPPTDVVLRGQARLLACLPGLASDDSTLVPEPAWPPGQVPAIPEGERYAFGPVFATGGLGVVRRGEDRRLGRTIAIKELLRDSPQAQQRFALEAAITARLQHPGIVPLYDLGWQGSGRPYYCMKLVDGESLEARISQATDVPARLRLLEHVIAVADAIAYAHDQQILHRDLKPANVLVGRFGETVVIDWGLAKDLSGRIAAEVTASEASVGAAGVSDMTEAGTVMGTLRYMPPEQAAGEAVDVRSDVYALGAILHHVLSGAPPFTGEGGPGLVRQVLAGGFEDLRRDAAIPRGLAAIARRAMARDPGDRYPSAAAFAEDLRRFAAGRMVSAHAYSLREAAGLWLRRHRTVVAASATVVTALAITGVIAATRIDRAQAEAQAAQRASEAAAGRAERAAFEQATLAAAGRAGEVLRLARTPGHEREALLLGVEVLAADDAPQIAVDGVSQALSAMLPVASLSSPDHAVYSLAFAPDGRRIATYPFRADAATDVIKVRSVDGGRLIATLPAGDNPLGTMVFAPDGERLAVSSSDHCTVWEVTTGAPAQTLPGCALPFFAVDGSSLFAKQPGAKVDESQLYTGLAAWGPGDAAPRWSVAVPGENFVALAHPDGRRIVVKRDHTRGEAIDLIDARDGHTLRTLTPSAPRGRYVERSRGMALPETLALSPDGTRLATTESTDAGRLLLWDLETARVQTLALERAAFHPVVFVGDDRLATFAGDLRMFDATTGAQTLGLPGQWLFAPIGAEAIAIDGDTMVRLPGDTRQTMPPGKALQVIGSADGAFLATLTGAQATLWSTRDHLAVDRWAPPRGHRVVSFAADEVMTRDDAGTLWVHDRGGERPTVEIPGQAKGDTAELWRVPGGIWRQIRMSLFPDESLRGVNRLRLHDDTGKQVYAHDDDHDEQWATAEASRRSTRVAAWQDGAITVRDAARDASLCAWPSAGVHALELSDSGAWVAALDRAGGLTIFEVATCARRATTAALGAAELTEKLHYLRSFEASDAGTTVLRYRSRTLVLAPTGVALDVTDPCRPSQPWGYARLSPDGQALITSCESSQVHERGWLRDVRDPARSVALDLSAYDELPQFSPVGDVLAYKTRRGRLAVLDRTTGAEITTIRGPSRLERFAFRPDGQVDALAADGAVYTYPTTVAGLRDAACRALAGTASADAAAAVCPRR